jgi:hypothetical protein
VEIEPRLRAELGPDAALEWGTSHHAGMIGAAQEHAHLRKWKPRPIQAPSGASGPAAAAPTPWSATGSAPEITGSTSRLRLERFESHCETDAVLIYER